MALRKLFIGANWKSNNTLEATKGLINKVYNTAKWNEKKIDVIIAPTFVHIPWVLENAKKPLQIAAQNTSLTKFGAFTGEVTAAHIKDLERRALYHECSDTVGKKANLALAEKLKVIFCVGETNEQRQNGETMARIEKQLNGLKNNISGEQWRDIVIAYEPVWAIGTGKVPTTEEAQQVHAGIRKWVSQNICSDEAKIIRILYGGSVGAKNSAGFIQQTDIDGFLIGGAALKPEILQIIETVDKVKK